MWSQTCLALKGGWMGRGGMELAEEVGWACGGGGGGGKGRDTQERGRNGRRRQRGWQWPEKEFGRRKGWRTWASYGPTQKLPRRWCLFGQLRGLDWAGLDELGVDRHSERSPKKMSSVGGDTHPPIAAPLSVLEGERAGGGRVTLGPVGLAVSQWPCKLEVWPSAPKGQDPPPTP